MSITKKVPSTLATVLRRSTGYHPPVHQSLERLFEGYTTFATRYAPLASNLAAVGRQHLGIELSLPAPPVLGAEVAALPFERAQAAIEQTVGAVADGVRQAFVAQRVGTLEWGADGDSCTFSFQEVAHRRGMFREVIRRTPHTHVLVRARIRPLDDRDVRLPPAARALVADLSPELRHELRVIVGTEVVRQVGATEVRKQFTPFGEKVLSFGKAAGQAAAVAGVGAAAVVGAGLLGATGLGAGLLLASVFVADPALVLGDVCLFGWEE